jgi:formyl-CoA transferase
MNSPLKGLRILDLTNVLSGPFCCHQLAHLGAEVIKVEKPGRGDLARQLGADSRLNREGMGVSFLAQNAGKKSLTINLKHPRGKVLFQRLVRHSDALVENFRPGVMDRLGLGYDALLTENPSLVYCAISGFGQTGPMSKSPAYDQIIQGLSGAMSITGAPGTAPYRVGFPVADTIGGLTAGLAITAALAGRCNSEEGCFIDVSMLDSVLATMGWTVSNYLVSQAIPQPMGNENATAAPSGSFSTRDGLLNIAANKQEQFEILCDVIGCPELINNPSFHDREQRKHHRGELKVALERSLARLSAAEWETRLNAAGVPAGRVLTVPEALNLPQVRSREMIEHFNIEVGGDRRSVDVLRTGFKISGEPASVGFPPAQLGAHTRELLMKLGLNDQDILELTKNHVI